MALFCNECGNEIIRSDRYCKHCGVRLSDWSSKKIKCPECGNYILENSEFCGNCGFKLHKDLFYVIKETNSKSCPKCSNKNNIDAEFCGNCGETLPIVSNLELINCPECNKLVREDVNFCRFCGHDFITNNIPLFKKKYRSTEAYCQNCGKKIINLNKSFYCDDCGTPIPSNLNRYSTTPLSHEEYQLIFINKFIVPLSAHYNENFRKTTLSQYFDISPNQESHIIFLIMNDLVNENFNGNIIEKFKEYLEETINLEDPKKEILSFVSSMIKDAFNSTGIGIADIATIEGSYYKTVETPVIQSKHGGLTKSAAFLGFGFLGLAATSGVKQTTKTKKVLQKGKYIHRKITVKDKYLVLKTYEDDSQNLNFNDNLDNINKVVLNWEDINSLDNEYYFIFNNGETLKCPIPDTTEWIAEGVMSVLGTTVLDENYKTNQIWIPKLESNVTEIFFDIIREKINKTTHKIQNTGKTTENTVNINELEKIMKMYQDGLLTNDEFLTMKQNIIGTINTMNDISNNDINNSPQFCGNCGAKIIKNSKFCSQCGNPL